MKIIPTSLREVLLIEPDVFGDTRGFFMETWHADKYAKLGLDAHFVQDNHSRSNKGVLRGLHYQLEHPQGKLVRVSQGSVFDVAVDIRKGSPTFSQWVGYELSGDNFRQLYVPPGFAHGFCVLSESADFIYKCTDFYAPEYEQGILWNDPDIAIDWPSGDILISDKDAANSPLKDMHAALPVHEDAT
ncbi:MAG TPA: dTDP-4-dehydrorhamnose 3,5-epimerase [Gammaproteobacteria bacterium]|nr:dTDP-4-dehydrorhamnose 3,5-epimerase [Gammaproteobacteria bacterium]